MRFDQCDHDNEYYDRYSVLAGFIRFGFSRELF